MSEKTRHLRLIVRELNSIASHLVGRRLLWARSGQFHALYVTFREREKILDLFEEVCGARLTYSYIAPGGVTDDAPAGWLRHVEAFLDQFEPVDRRLHALLTNNAIFVRRTAGIGVLAAGTAIVRLYRPGLARQRRRLGSPPRRRAALHRHVRGLHLRSHRVEGWQVPQDHPYPPVPPEAVVGDCWHRFFVRMLEVVQSVYLVRQGIEKYSQAPARSIGRSK